MYFFVILLHRGNDSSCQNVPLNIACRVISTSINFDEENGASVSYVIKARPGAQYPF